jgi:hypothetical protein
VSAPKSGSATPSHDDFGVDLGRTRFAGTRVGKTHALLGDGVPSLLASRDPLAALIRTCACNGSRITRREISVAPDDSVCLATEGHSDEGGSL